VGAAASSSSTSSPVRPASLLLAASLLQHLQDLLLLPSLPPKELYKLVDAPSITSSSPALALAAAAARAASTAASAAAHWPLRGMVALQQASCCCHPHQRACRAPLAAAAAVPGWLRRALRRRGARPRADAPRQARAGGGAAAAGQSTEGVASGDGAAQAARRR
jgi:hypothetical protein